MSFIDSAVGNISQPIDLNKYWEEKLRGHMKGKCIGKVSIRSQDINAFAVKWLNAKTGYKACATNSEYEIEWNQHEYNNEEQIPTYDNKGSLCSSCGCIYKKKEQLGYR